jgi:HK97 family phage portal protein
VDFTTPFRGKTVDGLWVPNSWVPNLYEQKEDRSQTGRFPSSADNGRILQGAPSAESKFKDEQSYIEAVKTVPWVFACVSLIAYSFATAHGDLYDGSDEPVENPNDPFLQIWAKPNPFQTGMVFKELLAMFILLAGEAFISLENQDAQGVPGEMYLPSPARMKVVQDRQTGQIVGYAYDTGGYQNQNGRYLPNYIPYGVDEIIHIKVANPLNMLRGLGNIEAMETTMNTMIAMTQNELNYWLAGGRITGVLETDQQVDNDTFDRLVNRWRMFSADKQARFKTAILEQGLKYTPVAEGFKGLDYSKLDLSKRDFVLANFGVPKNKLGIIEDAQYKSDEADRFFWSETMEPLLTRMEDHLNNGSPRSLVDIFHPEGDYAWMYERRNFEDDTVKLNNAMVMKSLKSFRLDEIRKYINVEPIGGKSGNSVVLAQTDVVVEIDELDHADTAAGTAGGGPPSTTAPDDMQRAQMAHEATQNKLKVKVSASRADLGHTHSGAPGQPGGQVPLPGVSVQGNGNENGRTGAVDGSGHTASSPGANTNPGGGSKAAPPVYYTERYSDEIVAMLSDEEKSALVEDYDRQIKAASVVRRNFRARGINVRLRQKSMGMDRVREYAEKRATTAQFEVKFVQRVPSHRPAIAALVSTRARQTRDTLTVKYSPVLREAASKVRRTLTPVLAKAMKISDPGLRHAYLKQNLSFAPINDVIQEIHVEAANEGWDVGKRTLGFSKRAVVETKASKVPTSPFLAQRYDRAMTPNVQAIDDRMMNDLQDQITLGLSRAYSPLQVANGVPDENFNGVAAIFGDAYDAERIVRTESMLALNWGAGNALLDSGATEEEALDGIDDPDCADRDGTVYEIDPDTGLAIDALGDPVRDHPNGTLAFIPTGNLSDLIDTGAQDVTQLDAAQWEGKAVITDGSQAAQYHRHRNGTLHAHDGGHLAHGHRWTKMPTTVAIPKAADDDIDTKAFFETMKVATANLAKLIDGES